LEEVNRLHYQQVPKHEKPVRPWCWSCCIFSNN